ncbi:MAG: molybdopterin-dependent oxidoreductase, partial [Gemmataceae bacterium]|nr:molybdopterin-dependent oxidoreductase [Gemmataceae bacterium]
EEIDVFPGRPLENKLAGNVVDLCPVGALGSKDFLYKQRVWYLHTRDSICSRCSSGCNIYVDSNKDIVYRLRPRYNPQVNGHFMCDDGRYGYHFTHAAERIRRAGLLQQPSTSASNDPDYPMRRWLAWPHLVSRLRQSLQSLGQQPQRRVAVILSPFLTVEEAFLLAKALRSLAPQAQLALGPVPVVGDDDRYPKDVHGRPVEPTRFIIRAEKCPNRRGVETVLRYWTGQVTPAEELLRQSWDALWFAGGYPEAAVVEAALPSHWSAPPLLVVQDLFPSPLTEAATFLFPATSSFEKEGTFINAMGIAQTFPRAVRPLIDARSELQLAHELLERPGLVQAAAVRRELGRAIPELAHLATIDPPAAPERIELATV